MRGRRSGQRQRSRSEIARRIRRAGDDVRSFRHVHMVGGIDLSEIGADGCAAVRSRGFVYCHENHIAFHS